jgi:aminoglycoside 3-N-acetyltransferase
MSAPAHRPVVTRQEIAAGLHALGLPERARVLVHSSLKSLGHVQGGADTVIDAILDVIGSGGTLVVPTLTFGGFELAGRRFDARTQPSETGRITETVRLRPEARRSLHPLSSAAALGAEAKEITTGHDDTPCGPGSPYWQLWERAGYTLFLGVDFACNSLFHVAEEIVAPAYLSYDVEGDIPVTDIDGNTRIGTYRRYACSRLGIQRHLGKMGRLYIEAGIVHTVQIGAARVHLLPARDNVGLAVELLQRDPEWILTP